MNMFSTEVSEDLEITVHFGPINNPNAPYYLHPMLYWSGGTLVVDYEVVPHTTLASFISSKTRRKSMWS